MIKINNVSISQNHFPDNTLMLLDFPVDKVKTENRNTIEWHYENDAELFTLICVVKHVFEKFPDVKLSLYVPFFPHSRMDRTKKASEVFTLKYFCDVINSLGFDEVYVLDPHSNVTPALIKNVRVLQPNGIVMEVVSKLDFHESDYLYFPDEGAYKRYGDLFPAKKNVLIGHKVRDWETGQIKGLRITTPEGYEPDEFQCMGRNVLMIDDIISYGGTLAYSADELKKLGFKHIYAYATHTENSVLDPEKGTLLKRLEDGTVDHIYTTCSTYTGTHDKITAFTA